jgi:hypothetical protein
MRRVALTSAAAALVLDLAGVVAISAASQGAEPSTQAAGEFSFDAMLRDLAGHTDRATARATAKSIEYPAEQLELAGAGWPWRPTALLAPTVTAVIGVALLPAAARRNRR